MNVCVVELPLSANALLQRLRERSETLCAETDKTEAGIVNGGFRYWLEPSGECVEASAARTVVSLGLVTCVMGGLLPCCPGQQWRAAA
jgi:hypothetical protein